MNLKNVGRRKLVLAGVSLAIVVPALGATAAMNNSGTLAPGASVKCPPASSANLDPNAVSKYLNALRVELKKQQEELARLNVQIAANSTPALRIKRAQVVLKIQEIQAKLQAKPMPMPNANGGTPISSVTLDPDAVSPNVKTLRAELTKQQEELARLNVQIAAGSTPALLQERAQVRLIIQEILALLKPKPMPNVNDGAPASSACLKDISGDLKKLAVAKAALISAQDKLRRANDQLAVCLANADSPEAERVRMREAVAQATVEVANARKLISAAGGNPATGDPFPR